jgi:hypothetical protein
MPKEKKTKQKQKQRQSQNVKVIVNLAEKRKRKRRAKKKASPEAQSEVVNFKAFPPQIVYPTAPLVFSQPPPAPVSLARSIDEKVKPPTSMLEDIGNVGTEGNVEILDLPTRRETLAELQTPIPLKDEKKTKTLAQSLKLRLPSNMTEGLSTEGDMFAIPEQKMAVITPATREEDLNVKEDLPEEIVVRKTGKGSRGPRGPRGPNRSKEQIRQDLEADYEKYTGLLAKPNQSNDELNVLIYAEKRRKDTIKGVEKRVGKKILKDI